MANCLRKLCSFILPFLAASATVHEKTDREIGQHDHLYMEVDSAGSTQKSPSSDKNIKERGAEHSRLASGASLAEMETRQTLTRLKYLPQYPTGPATCDGSQLACPADGSVDPCSTLKNCSTGGFHDCSGSLKICLPNKETLKCESGDDCLLRCTGKLAEESDGSLKKCKELTEDKCNGYYAADPDYLKNGIGYECVLREDRTCGVETTCGVQNPPESLGEQQCFAPEVYRGASNGTCQTKRIRPGKDCQTKCSAGFTPSTETLKCQDGGVFEPTTFSCIANPCRVKQVENALNSGCKEGPEEGEAVIESGLVCTTQCKEGFYQSDDVLRCHAETLSPATFTCEATCAVPSVSNAAAGGICKEGKDQIMPFTSCTTQCATGYTPSVEKLSCRNGAFTPGSIQCNPDPCDAPTGVEFGRTKGPCQEGWTLTSGSACTTQCRAGYTPSIASLACNAGTLAPATFQCVPNPCPIPTVKNRLGNGCRGVAGSSVESGKSCKASCKSGYTPSVKQLDCYAETLTPETFVCEPNPCSIPVDSNQEGSGCLGVPGQKDGTVIEHGETCQSECKEGYHPSVESMSCSLGTLSPAKWSCIEDACPAVEGVANAPKVTCKEGNSINSQKSCTTKCRDGYKPNYASLTCRLGKFFPHTYICEPEGCPLPVVKNRLTSGCSGLPHPAVVTSGQSCSAQCDNGYTPSVASLKCFAGKLTPATFVCNEDPCDAPGGIQNGATESCKEGKEIASGDKCTSQCAAGYVPSTAQLSCSLGKLTPSFYSCNPEPCTLPQFANRKGNGCKSKSGQTVASGETCTAECAAGYTPNELSLKCYAGVLTPATFSCFPDPCPLPSISKAQGNGCSNLGGSMIDSGLKCEAACQTGYTPSVKVLACQASILTPDTFTCNPNGCTLPKVQNQAGNGCQGIKGSSIGSGKTCKTQCAAGFTPDVESLSCFAEELTPSTFTCNPTPCTLPAVANAQGNGCKGKVGTVIASGATCKTACMPGYEASEDKLECSAGSLSPATFACAELKCRAPTGIPHAPHVGCAEGRTIKGGKTCTPRCNSGYSPSAASLACKQGVFEPTSYGCLPGSCSIPQISNAASPKCEQGDTIKHGQKCTPKCKPNYIPSNSGLTCTAGNLEPTTFTCKAPCASPNVANAAQPCKEGNLIEHGKSCSSQCDVGFSATSGSLECNDGQLGGAITCQIDMPESGSNFYNCWSGDPHFTCRGGRRSDPLVPGTHWVLKQACPNSPNFMWVQGVYGPVSPSGAMATAFGGMFLGKNILTIRAAARPNWIVKWNDKNLDKAWKLKSGRRRRRRRGKAKYVYDLYGTELSVYMNGNKIEAGLGYGVTYKAHRHRWNRQNWKISGLYYTDYYQSNQLWTKLCKDGSYGGESIDLPHPRHLYRPAGDDRMVSTAYDLFQQTRATIETKLNTMTTAASLFAEEEVMEANMSLVKKAQPCTGAALEAAEKSCAVLKKETTEEEKEEIEEDEEAKDNQEATYQACVADACMTASNDFGAAGQDVEEESEMQAALKHKKEFRVVAENGACSEGWLATDPNENILSDEEKTRAQQKKNNCTVACKLCRPERRRYLAGPLVLHNETRDACIDQRLAMPKSQEDKERLWTLQKQHCTADKAWVGARYTGGGWKWDDESAVAGIQASGTEGDYLCIDKEEGTLVNCEHSTSEKNDALCEGVWY